MRKYLLLLVFYFISFFCFSQINPSNISGLVLWLRADSNVVLHGDTISQWGDCSGNGNNAIQTTPLSQPLYITNSINGKPVISFNGLNQFLVGPTISNINTSSITIFVVANGASGSGYSSGFFDINSYPNFIFGRGYLT
ncbi:MAG: hypothetical protein ABR968_13840, partial [Bacteroidales bacterium]